MGNFIFVLELFFFCIFGGCVPRSEEQEEEEEEE